MPNFNNKKHGTRVEGKGSVLVGTDFAMVSLDLALTSSTAMTWMTNELLGRSGTALCWLFRMLIATFIRMGLHSRSAVQGLSLL